jgi:hypothetical protein
MLSILEILIKRLQSRRQREQEEKERRDNSSCPVYKTVSFIKILGLRIFNL